MYGYKGYQNAEDLRKQYGGGFFESKQEQEKVATQTWPGFYCSRNLNVAKNYTQGGLATVFMHKDGIGNICNVHNCNPTFNLDDVKAASIMNYVKGPNKEI